MAIPKLRTGIAMLIGATLIGVVLVVAGIGSRHLFEKKASETKASQAQTNRPKKAIVEEDRFHVAAVQGVVDFVQDGKVYVLQAGDLLSLKDVIRTGKGARVLLHRKSSELEVRENLEVQLQSIANQQAEFSIIGGKGAMSANVRDVESTVRINSDDIHAVNVGPSRWVVARGEEGKVAVAVSEGNVQFAGHGSSVIVKAGTESVATKTLPPSSPNRTPEDLLLDVVWPEASQAHDVAAIEGKASPASTVLVNGREVTVNADGTFKAEVPLKVGNNPVQVQAEDLQGRKKVAAETVRRQANAPALESAKEDLWAP
jgi:hypothetical protein